MKKDFNEFKTSLDNDDKLIVVLIIGILFLISVVSFTA